MYMQNPLDICSVDKKNGGVWITATQNQKNNYEKYPLRLPLCRRFSS